MFTVVFFLSFFLHVVFAQLIAPHMITPPNYLLTDPFAFLDFTRRMGFPSLSNPLTKISDEEGWILQIDVPGLSKDEISVTTSVSTLKISGKHECSHKDQRDTDDSQVSDPTCIERLVMEEISFPEDADLKTVQAELENGVLRVLVKPTSGSVSSRRSIPIAERTRRFVNDVKDSRGKTAEEHVLPIVKRGDLDHEKKSGIDQDQHKEKGFADTIKEKLGWTSKDDHEHVSN